MCIFIREEFFLLFTLGIFSRYNPERLLKFSISLLRAKHDYNE